MLVSRLMGRVKNFYKLFIAPPRQWTLPKKSQILIYDAVGSDVIAPYLKRYSVEILALHGESVNVPCLLRAVLSFEFWKGKPHQAYEASYIRLVNPGVIVTFIDNSINFYGISQAFPKITTIFLQNGLRGGGRDIFASIQESGTYRVDYMFVFNRAFGEAYKKFISGEFIAVGSFKNNHAKKCTESKDDGILFISQFRKSPKKGEAFTIDENGVAVYWDTFYAAEIRVLSFLNKWCFENKKLLRICGCLPDHEVDELEFFTANLNDCDWEFVAKSDNYSSYQLVDDAEIVVFIDSALGFESIGRGKRTAGLSIRGGIINDRSINFGWPAALPDEGPFWTSSADDRQLQRVMDYLAAVGDEEWERVRLTYAQDLMVFDPGNTPFQALLERLLLQSRASISNLPANS